MRQPATFTPLLSEKILVFAYDNVRGPDVDVLQPVEVPDDVVTMAEVLDWLPTVCTWADAKYLVIEPKHQLEAKTTAEEW